jgi:nicotinamidase-related amidase
LQFKKQGSIVSTKKDNIVDKLKIEVNIMNIQMLIIDPQNDFIDIPNEVCEEMKEYDFAESEKTGATKYKKYVPTLPVVGAWEDSIKLARFIEKSKKVIDSITLTMDTHEQFDVAHPMFWMNDKGEHPTPFTIISAKDVKDQIWKPVHMSLLGKMIRYTEELEKNGNFPLCIWPPHCVTGSMGYKIVAPIEQVLYKWEFLQKNRVNKVCKGHNPFTEHYGAFKAEVIDPQDETTNINIPLIKRFEKADIILLTGQALSHCVNTTVTQLADNFGEENIKKLVFLTDTSSPVTGFEQDAEDFIKRLTKRGMRCIKTTDIKFENNTIVLP